MQNTADLFRGFGLEFILLLFFVQYNARFILAQAKIITATMCFCIASCEASAPVVKL